MSVRSGYITLFFLVGAIVAKAQTFEWLKAYGTMNGLETSYFMCANPDGGYTFTFDCQKAWSSSGLKDTIHFDSHFYEKYKNGPGSLGLAPPLSNASRASKL